MWENIKEMLGLEGEIAISADSESPEGLHLATAALLVHVSLQDKNISEEERAQIIACLDSEFGLSEEIALKILSQAKQDESNAIDLYSFTRVVTAELDQEGVGGRIFRRFI